MSYPSLLFIKPPADKQIDLSVFDDLKLSLLISPEAVEAMRTPCSPGDIPLRQALFSRILTDLPVRNTMRSLARSVDNIHRLYAAFSDIRCDNERYFLYLNLISEVIRFYHFAASLPPDNPVLERFSNFFSSQSESELCRNIADECERLRPMSEKARVNSLRLSGEQLFIRPVDDDSIVSRLLKCAIDLGLTPARDRRDIAMRLNPRIINALGSLHPSEFSAFRDFYNKYSDFFDEDILKFRFELNFYLEIAEVFDKVRDAAIPICFPHIADTKKINIRGLRDISLLAKNETAIVPNDILFDPAEPFFFLTGANGGGKTTYLRSAGIAAILFLTGCPIACESAELFPLDSVYTHFPRDERFDSDGRFADEEARVNYILNNHAGNSLVLLNETYSTTGEELALKLTAELADTIFASGSLGLYITHQHGIGDTNIPFLSVIIDETDENRRTYKIERKRGASGSYAHDILKKYAMTEQELFRRFPERSAL